MPQPARYRLHLNSQPCERFTSADVAYVTVQQLPGFDHVNSWIQAMPRAVAWFRCLN